VRHNGLRAAVVVALMLAWNTFAAIAPPPAPATRPGPVVVNELAADRYIELRNVSESTVDIGGFELWLCDTGGGVRGTLRIAVGPALAAGETYVIAAAEFTGAPADQTYAGRFPRGGAALLDLDHGWVDGVAVVADSPCGEADPAPECPHASTARDPASTDTGRNATDFSCRRCSPGEPN
jgi:hypothetical protein